MSDFKFTCPHCKQHLEAPPEVLGQTIQCPSCKGQLTLPKPTPPAPPVRITTVPPLPPPLTSNHALGTCPLCGNIKHMGKARPLYGHMVCKKCYYAFANRRQLAFAIDIGIWHVIFLTFTSIFLATTKTDLNGIWYASLLIFFLKDGFAGTSPGKAICGVRVMDEKTGKAIGPHHSFLRNLPLLIPFMPLIVAFQLCKGHRTGDGWSQTKVIWKKYANHPIFAPNQAQT